MRIFPQSFLVAPEIRADSVPAILPTLERDPRLDPPLARFSATLRAARRFWHSARRFPAPATRARFPAPAVLVVGRQTELLPRIPDPNRF